MSMPQKIEIGMRIFTDHMGGGNPKKWSYRSYQKAKLPSKFADRYNDVFDTSGVGRAIVAFATGDKDRFLFNKPLFDGVEYPDDGTGMLYLIGVLELDEKDEDYVIYFVDIEKVETVLRSKRKKKPLRVKKFNTEVIEIDLDWGRWKKVGDDDEA